MKKLLLIFLLATFAQQSVFAQKALKVWIVRHAEKSTYDPKDKDPELSDEGKIRAEALMKELKGKKLDSIFVTDYKRTKLTAFPLADDIGLAIKSYNPAEQKTFAQQLIKDAAGEKILIVGHSNTVLELIEAFGGRKPVKELTDDDYDYLFELSIKGTTTDVKVSRYGASHHSDK